MFAAMLGEAWHDGCQPHAHLHTMLGMVIGVEAVVLMMRWAGAQESVKQSINAMGSNLFIVLSGSSTSAARAQQRQCQHANRQRCQRH